VLSPRGFAVALLLVASCGRTAPPSSNPEATALSHRAYTAYASGLYAEALDLWTQAERIAIASGDLRNTLAARMNIASCHLLSFSYHQAMQMYLDARELARRLGDEERQAVIAVNVALLYGVLGDFRRTVETGEEALRNRKLRANPYRSTIHLHVGNAYHRLGRTTDSDRHFRLAVSEAEKIADAKQQAAALDHFGLALLDRGEISAAEPLLKAAHEIRSRTAADDLAMSNRSLGMLRARQGRCQEAIQYLTAAIESTQSTGRRTPLYELYAERARAFATLGEEAEALADFRSALAYTRRWRIEVLPAGMLPAHWEGALARLRSSFIRFAAEAALRTGNRELALEALAAAEESRLAALRTSVPRPNADGLPAYHAKIQQLQALEASLLGREPGAPDQAKLARLRQEIRDLESGFAIHGDTWLPPLDPVGLARQQIAVTAPSTTILSIFLDSPHSYLWEVRRGQVELRRIAARERIEGTARAFREAVEKDDPQAAALGEELYAQIFGEISHSARTSPVWTLILDGNLFEVPWAAVPPGESGRFLVERHALRTAPSLFLSADKGPEKGRFVGVADPIYNRADNRLSAPVSPTLEFARLVASGAELEACLRAWNSEAVSLRGPDATPDGLAGALTEPVAALHFATHFVRSAEDESRTLIALGIAPGRREPSLLGPEQIAALGARAGVVVLSGCQSGTGQVIEGAGLMGLTRSWLAAGAANVAASLWPTPDDQGMLFQSFYRHYAAAIEGRTPFAAARSLRAAQLEMLRSGEWRSSPRYWAAFFLVSKG
jgi:CHAT domain-containing protein/Tfp pilus assembly protein PilF